jgi:hypothetical protein
MIYLVLAWVFIGFILAAAVLAVGGRFGFRPVVRIEEGMPWLLVAALACTLASGWTCLKYRKKSGSGVFGVLVGFTLALWWLMDKYR